jgi:hypothetical protein
VDNTEFELASVDYNLATETPTEKPRTRAVATRVLLTNLPCTWWL